MMQTEAFATNWQTIVGEDSDGPRCAIFAKPEDTSHKNVITANNIAYFTINNFNPLYLEFSFKFPQNMTIEQNAKISIGQAKFKINQKSGNFGWIAKNSEKKIQKMIFKYPEFNIKYQIDGKNIYLIYRTEEIKRAISILKTECRISA